MEATWDNNPGASASSDPPPSGVGVNIDDSKAQDGLGIPGIYDNIPLGQRDDDNIDMKPPVGADLTSVPGAFKNSFMVEKMRYYDVALEEKKIKDLGITDAESQWQEYNNYWIFVKRHPNATVPTTKSRR